MVPPMAGLHLMCAHGVLEWGHVAIARASLLLYYGVLLLFNNYSLFLTFLRALVFKPGVIFVCVDVC